jgi:predicted nucleic acid-binding protein
MQLFFDTSAVLPLLLKESGSDSARMAYLAGEAFFAWTWMSVESEAALVRRKADAVTWRNWRNLKRTFTWLGFPESATGEVCAFNRELGLRAADAGHLYVFEKAVAAVPELRLVTFDGEMASAAAALELKLYSGG